MASNVDLNVEEKKPTNNVVNMPLRQSMDNMDPQDLLEWMAREGVQAERMVIVYATSEETPDGPIEHTKIMTASIDRAGALWMIEKAKLGLLGLDI